jgi:predicted cation transporter
MGLPAAIFILFLLLFGPIAIEIIERNIELYFLALGIIAVALGGGFDRQLIEHALTEPIAITIAVVAASLVFGATREHLDRLFARLRRRMPRPVLAAGAVFVLGALSSVITAIVAALVLVETVGLLHLGAESRLRFTVAGCFAIGLGAALTPLGEPLSTLAASALKLGFLGLFDLLAPYVVSGMAAASVLAGVFARGDYNEARAGAEVREAPSGAVVRGAKIYAFVGGLVLVSHAYAPLAREYVARLGNDLLFWANTVSAVLDNATLVALEVHGMTLARAREAIVALLVSGGMLIPGNIPNIICAGILRIGSVEWARIALPIGLVMLGIYFAVFKAAL